MTKKALAEAMAYDPSRVSHIESGRQLPTEEFTRQAEAALQTGGALWECWEAIASARFGLSTRLPERELRTGAFVGWLAEHSAASFQSLYASVCRTVARIEAEPPSARHARNHSRRLVTRDQLAGAVLRYYGQRDTDGAFYRVQVGRTDLRLSMLTRPEWVETAVELGTESELIGYTTPDPDWRPRVDPVGLDAAIHRLAGVEVGGIVMVNNPLYRLLEVELGAGGLTATVTTVDFAEHALTSELMEGELINAVASSSDAFPLRDEYLPTCHSAFALRDRACVGGPVSLLAVARCRPDGSRDYVLFAQERSAAVLNLAGKLALVPKGFHQPTGEPASEAHLSVTVRREFEEELLGREDLEQISAAEHRLVDPLHTQHTTPPMAWLLERPGSFRIDCTGLGFNMVTGNYEFACLIVIDDEAWWDQFGHLVETNWEAERVHRFSTLDTAGIEALVADPRWGNESLFSLVQGLRRLGETGDVQRIAIPTIRVAFS